jgi:hypothetical protein
MTNDQFPIARTRRLSLVIGNCSLVIAVSVLLAACTNPRANLPAANEPAAEAPRGPEAERQTVRMSVSHSVGARYRTSRTLRVEELTADGSVVVESEEVTLTTVLRVDESGRALAVRRSWEASGSSLSRDGRPAERAAGELDGVTLELTQRASGVEARVIVGDVSVGRQQFVLEGFDSALLPADAVQRGQSWTLEGEQLAGLNRLIEALGFRLERNRLSCNVAAISDESVDVALDWRVTARRAGQPAVLRFTGTLRYDRGQRLITSFALNGGRLGDEGVSSEVEIRIRRKPVEGWLDFGE